MVLGSPTSDLRAGQLLTTRWTPTLGAATRPKEARLWKERLALDVCLGPGLTDTWLQEGEANGYSFVALRTADEFIAEAFAMDNCLDRYTDRLEGRTARIFSIRRDGRSIADIEIAAHEHEPGHPRSPSCAAPTTAARRSRYGRPHTPGSATSRCASPSRITP